MSTITKKIISLDKIGKVYLRAAVPKDAKGVLEIMKEVLKEKLYAIHEIDEFEETNKSYIRKIRSFRKEPGKIFIVAEFNNEIVGFVNFKNWDTRKTMHTGFLSIFIKKKFRGEGIGRALLEELIRWAKKNPIIHKMSLAVFANNKKAISLYMKMGFKIEGICPRDIKINRKYYDSVFMYIFTN